MCVYMCLHIHVSVQRKKGLRAQGLVHPPVAPESLPPSSPTFHPPSSPCAKFTPLLIFERQEEPQLRGKPIVLEHLCTLVFHSLPCRLLLHSGSRETVTDTQSHSPLLYCKSSLTTNSTPCASAPRTPQMRSNIQVFCYPQITGGP